MLALVVVAVLAVRGCAGDAPKAAAGAGGPADPARLGAEGMEAPGTAELRALGCSRAAVVDLQRLMGGGSARDPLHADEPRTMVTCDVGAVAASPGCEKLATAYFRAIGGTAAANVCVRVNAPGPSGANAPVCSRLYAPNGIDLGPFPRVP